MGDFLGKVRDWIDRAKDVLSNGIARYFLIIIIVVFVVVVAMGKSYGAVPVMTYESSGVGLTQATFYEESCNDKAVLGALSFFEAQGLPIPVALFKNANVVYGGKPGKACWGAKGNAVIVVYDDPAPDFAYSILPKAALKKSVVL